MRHGAGSAVALAMLLSACSNLIGVRDIFLEEGTGPIGAEGGVDGPTGADGPIATDGGDGSVVTCNADLQKDPKNCGACDHDCSNGVCNAGLCTLAETLRSPNTIAVRGGSVYLGLLGGTGAIVSCPTSGCASATVGTKNLTVDAGDPYPWRIAVTDTHVWASDYLSGNKGGVRRVLAGGGDFQKFPAGDLERSYGIAVDQTSVYWTTEGSPGAVHWCDLPACANGLQVAAPTTSAAELIAVAADGTIVWADGAGGVLRRCATKVGCTPADLVPDFNGVVTDLTIEGTTVYWGTTFGEVLSCATSGCANPTKVAVEPTRSVIGAVAVSGSSLFWSAMPFADGGNSVVQEEGVIRTCTMPKCSGADVRTLATKQKDPSAMAVDARSIYWSNSGKRGFSDGIGNLLKAPR